MDSSIPFFSPIGHSVLLLGRWLMVTQPFLLQTAAAKTTKMHQIWCIFGKNMHFLGAFSVFIGYFFENQA
ncbi:MAG: hypothetical protein IJQ11_00315 [Bacteroidales bacterium]|nr:hypothetical protein [Bacteroidales bacterium]